MSIIFFLLSYEYKTTYNTQFSCHALFGTKRRTLHYIKVLIYGCSRGLFVPLFFVLISLIKATLSDGKTNQTGAPMLVLVQPLALAFPLLLTLHALEEEPPQTEESHQLVRYTTNNLISYNFTGLFPSL